MRVPTSQSDTVAAISRTARSGSLTSGAVSVSGSGSSYTVTVNNLSGEGTLALNLIDDDTIRDVMTNPAQSHALGGGGAGNGSFTTGEASEGTGVDAETDVDAGASRSLGHRALRTSTVWAGTDTGHLPNTRR